MRFVFFSLDYFAHLKYFIFYSMLSQVTFNREKWMASVMLDPVTGLDPPGIKVRAAQGKYSK